MEKVIAFGDIHGCYKAAKSAVELAVTESAQAVFLGDYVDRGPDSIKTLEILIEAKEKYPDWVFLRGNHDQMLLDLINGESEPDSVLNVLIGQTSNNETTKVYNQWKSLPKDRKKRIVDFLNDTKFYYDTKYRTFVHAPLKNNSIPLEEKTNEELIWNYSLSPVWDKKEFIHGHAVVDKVTKQGKGININTKCGYGGCLTGMLIKMTRPFEDNKEVLKTQRIGFFITEDGKVTQLN